MVDPHGMDESLVGQQQEPDDGLLWEAVRSGEAIFVPDTATPDVRWPSPLCRALIAGMRACACIPLKTAEATIGLMHLTNRTPRAPTPAERRLLAALAEMAGNALHRATLHEQTEQRLQHLNALHTIDLAISSNLNLNVTLNVFLDQVMAQLRPDAAAVLLFDAPTQMLDYAAGRGFRTDALQHTHIRLGEGYAGRAALQQETITIPDLRQHKTGFLRSPLFALEGFLAYHALPLIAKGQVQGVLENFHRAPTTHDPDWWDFLKALAVQVAIALDNATLFTNLQHSNTELSLAYDTTLEGWAMALELRDQETAGHTRRVTELAVRVARELGMKDDELLHLRRGALLHDIGKMGLPDSILLKPGPLTDDEQAFMRQHPQFAYNMLFPIAFLRSALDIPYCHHEKWDGTGYPRGLKGETIPLPARIFAVVDIWDALCSNRPYRPAWPRHEVREHISALAGTHFDSRVVEVFLRLLDDFEPM
ncbi:MAG: HD domain-containing phosphohydrolase [Chloroflexota bacterium]